jgi:hypothetical protein
MKKNNEYQIMNQINNDKIKIQFKKNLMNSKD